MTMRLIPARRDIGWTPFIWTIYLAFFLLWPYMRHAGAGEWIATLSAVTGDARILSLMQMRREETS